MDGLEQGCTNSVLWQRAAAIRQHHSLRMVATVNNPALCDRMRGKSKEEQPLYAQGMKVECRIVG